MSLPLHPSFGAASPVSPITRTFPQSPHHSLTYCSGLSAREAGKEWDLFSLLRRPTVSPHPPLALLLVAWQVRNKSSPKTRTLCVFIRLSVRPSRSDEWRLLPSGDSCLVVSTARGLPPCFFEWMCVLLMLLAVTCTHCYQHDLCFPLSAEYSQCSTHLAVLAFFPLCTQDAFLLVMGPECVHSSLSMCLRFKVSHSSCLMSLVSVKPLLSHAEACPFGPFLSAIKN